MRLTSAIWFAVFMRSESARGAYVSVVKSGAQQAGALFIIQNHLNGSFSLYSPAPQAFFDDSDDGERKFECALENVTQEEIDAYLERQKNFDPDLWIIETESGNGDISLIITERE